MYTINLGNENLYFENPASCYSSSLEQVLISWRCERFWWNEDFNDLLEMPLSLFFVIFFFFQAFVSLINLMTCLALLPWSCFWLSKSQRCFRGYLDDLLEVLLLKALNFYYFNLLIRECDIIFVSFSSFKNVVLISNAYWKAVAFTFNFLLPKPLAKAKQTGAPSLVVSVWR